ncbi:MAG: PPOX class F420-dependent oxidoreductase [Actinomycetota bacterium]|nr:PPOX class F420-dependent oxidoreductase [Actinomycetota bacterium]
MATQMPEKLTDAQKQLFLDKNFAFVATTCPDGYPHVSPVWIDFEDDYILMNTAKDRVKERNLRRDPKVAVSIYDSSDPYKMVAVQGTAVEMTTEGADEHIDKLARKYRGWDEYPAKVDRVLVKIRPERVATMGL